jgi:DNA modification methylase
MKNILKENKLVLIKDLRANKGQLVDRGIPTNPRKITKDKYNLLLQSLDKSNLTQIRPLDVIEHEGKFIVLSGNQRLRALKELKVKEVPCNILRDDLEPETYRQIVLQANTNYGEHDDDLLANEWDAVELHEWGYDLPDWETEKIEEETQGDDDVPGSAPAITVKGDLYLLGEHRLLCGDSTMIDDVEKLMDGEKADMVFTDPPYGMNAVSNSGVLSKNYKSDILNDDSVNVAKNCFNLCLSLNINKMVFWGANYYSSSLPDSSCWLVWDKNNGQSDQMDCELAWTNLKGCTRQYTQASEKTNRVHPTQKPVSLAEWCFAKYDANTVIDLFLGSGSTLIACEKTNRKCYGMELDEKYCDVIVKRYIEFCVKNNKEAKVYRNGELISNDVFLVG